MTVLAIQKWKSNAELIAACAELGYLRTEWATLDTTYGHGTFWKLWRPEVLVGCDIDEAKSPYGFSVDFTKLPWGDGEWDAVVFDPPYKLNGRPDPAIDARYGVAERSTWQDRMRLIIDGAVECSRVLGDGYLLVKCQDQVVSGHKVWQTDEVTRILYCQGLMKVDRFDLLSYRPQPEGRRQVHAHSCSSQLLVFKR